MQGGYTGDALPHHSHQWEHFLVIQILNPGFHNLGIIDIIAHEASFIIRHRHEQVEERLPVFREQWAQQNSCAVTQCHYPSEYQVGFGHHVNLPWI